MMNTEIRTDLVRACNALNGADLMSDIADVFCDDDPASYPDLEHATDFYAEAIWEVALDDGLITRDDDDAYDFVTVCVFARLVSLIDAGELTLRTND